MLKHLHNCEIMYALGELLNNSVITHKCVQTCERRHGSCSRTRLLEDVYQNRVEDGAICNTCHIEPTSTVDCHNMSPHHWLLLTKPPSAKCIYICTTLKPKCICVCSKRYRIAKCNANWPPLQLKMPRVSPMCDIKKPEVVWQKHSISRQMAMD